MEKRSMDQNNKEIREANKLSVSSTNLMQFYIAHKICEYCSCNLQGYFHTSKA